MAINFDSLPQEKPVGNLLEPGLYKAHIEKAEMRTPKSGGDDYLVLTLDCKNDAGAVGKVWDNFFDVDKELPRYKLQRLITALRIPITGAFELKDLCKVVAGKDMLVDIGVDEKSDRPRNQIEVFKGEIYYHTSEWAALVGAQTAPDEDLPFIDATDAVDAVEEKVSTPGAETVSY